MPAVQLNVIISGHGSVRVSVGSDCGQGTCSYHVPQHTVVTLVAVDHGNNVFQQWQGAPCAGQGQTCQFAATGTTMTASVLFDHGH